MAVPILHLSGSPYEQAIQHARQLRDRIVRNLSGYFEGLEREAKVPPETGYALPTTLAKNLKIAEIALRAPLDRLVDAGDAETATQAGQKGLSYIWRGQ